MQGSKIPRLFVDRGRRRPPRVPPPASGRRPLAGVAPVRASDPAAGLTMSLVRWRSVVFGAIVASAAAACGRSATEADCEEIVERIARLQLEADGPARAETVAAEVEAFKARARERVRAECVGKPMSARVLGCARAATRVEAVEECFR
mgnify:CR=1 FL=1